MSLADKVAEHSETEPSCLIYITDGCGPVPENPPPYPVLWILTGDGEKNRSVGMGLAATNMIQEYGIAVMRQFCYNVRHESNNSDS